MSWKPSKRQTQLKQRLIKSSRVYLETSHTLDQMLLKMLHNNDVYTPDDFYNKYIKSEPLKTADHRIPADKLPHRPVNSAKPSINRTLVDLDQVLHQLKRVIDDDR